MVQKMQISNFFVDKYKSSIIFFADFREKKV